MRHTVRHGFHGPSSLVPCVSHLSFTQSTFCTGNDGFIDMKPKTMGNYRNNALVTTASVCT